MPSTCSEQEGDPVSSAISSVFSKLDKELLAQAAEDRTSYGTTAVLALQLGSVVYVAHAGAPCSEVFEFVV